jgi:putative transposase
MIRMWRNSWENFIPFLAFPPDIRKLVYTTNQIESLNARFRQATRRRGHFPTEQAALKVLYLVIKNPLKNRTNITGKTVSWKQALNTLSLHYGDRINAQ